MRVAITGVTGMLGYQVARAALDAGHEVVALVRPSTDRRTRLRTLAASGRLTQSAVALTDSGRLARALEGSDALIHCAALYAYGSERSAEVARVNVDGTRAVVEAAAAAGLAKVVVTSSSVTCGSSVEPRARTEADRLGTEPAPAYYASKVAQEEVALEAAAAHGIPLVLALPTIVLGGPFARLGPSNAIVLRYLLDPTRSTFPGGCNVVDTRDVGAGHVVLLEHGIPGRRYLLGGDDLSWRSLHALVAELAGLPGPYAEATQPAAWLASAAAEAWGRLTSTAPLSTREEAATVGRYYWYSSARARDLGYAARPARAAVAASLAWLAVGTDLPRWAREGLRLAPEVRAARPLLPRPLDGDCADVCQAEAEEPGGVTVRRPRPSRPRRPPHPR